RRKADLRLPGCVLATVVLAEAALLFFPHVLLLHPAQGGAAFKQVSGYAMVALMLAAMVFGMVRRWPVLAGHHRTVGDVHQFGGLLILLLMSLHVAGRPAGFLLLMFHGMAAGLAAGAVRALLGTKLGRAGATM